MTAAFCAGTCLLSDLVVYLPPDLEIGLLAWPEMRPAIGDAAGFGAMRDHHWTAGRRGSQAVTCLAGLSV